jgi:hypothetical protein
LPNGHAEHFPLDIPQGDVDTAESGHEGLE